MKWKDEKRHLIYEKPPVVDPISASDFYHLGMINTISRDGMYNVPEYNDFNPDKLKAIEYFNKSIELDPNYYPSYFMRGLTKYSINQKDGCEDIKKALSFENFMSPATAQKFLKENCN
jgi:tetratricopeptide (TPR) repeat protein